MLEKLMESGLKLIAISALKQKWNLHLRGRLTVLLKMTVYTLQKLSNSYRVVGRLKIFSFKLSNCSSLSLLIHLVWSVTPLIHSMVLSPDGKGAVLHTMFLWLIGYLGPA